MFLLPRLPLKFPFFLFQSNYPNSVSGAGEGGGVGGSSSTRTVFGCDDVVVCQFEKVRRQKNRWHLVLKVNELKQ